MTKLFGRRSELQEEVK